MDTTSSDSDGAQSPVLYDQSRVSAYAVAVTGYGDCSATKSPSRHSESSGGSAEETRSPCNTAAKVHHHKFSIDRILGRFGGGNATVIDAVSSRTAAASESVKCHRNDTLIPLQRDAVGEFSFKCITEANRYIFSHIFITFSTNCKPENFFYINT